MLETCPRCGYSLITLPAEHTCPECALRYDAQSEAWRPKKRWPILLGAASIAACMIVVPVLTLASGWPSNRLASYAFAGGYVLLMGVILLGLWRALRRGQVAAVTTDGLFLVDHLGRARLIQWNRIREVKRQPLRVPPAVMVFLEERIRYVQVRNVFAGGADADRFVAAVHARIHEHRT